MKKVSTATTKPSRKRQLDFAFSGYSPSGGPEQSEFKYRCWQIFA
jgi:hypothetical protein